MIFSDTELTSFLANHWRQATYVKKNALSADKSFVTRDQLVQLCNLDEVESRLIHDDYTVTFGPFEDDGSSSEQLLGDGEMLMVQCLEQHLQTISDLLDNEFGFIARWQVDDVMASLGYDDANCGAHFDHYDVFLVQVSGKKTWHLDQGGHVEDELDPDADLRLLQSFTATETHELEPGDVLYVPPGVGHHGICTGESITLSVGVRNPTLAELLAEVSEFGLMNSNPQSLPGIALTGDNALSPSHLKPVEVLLASALNSETLIQWYASYVTRLRVPEVLDTIERDVLKPGDEIQITLPSRVVLFRQSDGITLFANGDPYLFDASHEELLQSLVDNRSVHLPNTLDTATLDNINALAEAAAVRLVNS